MTSPRTPKEVIDDAIRENRKAEIFCFALTGLFSTCGLVTLILAAVRGDGLIATAGGVATSLFWPSLDRAMKIRRQNIAIRLLEAALSHAETADEAVAALNSFFEREFFPKKEAK